MRRIDAARAVREGSDDDDDPPAAPSPEAMPSHQIPSDKGKPLPKSQRNFTDADSRIMLSKGAYVLLMTAKKRAFWTRGRRARERPESRAAGGGGVGSEAEPR